MCVCVCVGACVCMHMHRCTCLHVIFNTHSLSYTHPYTLISIHTHIRAHPLTHTHTRTYMHTHTYAHTHIYTHIHTQASELPALRCDVSLLLHFEECKSWSDWEVGRHGITIDFEPDGARGRRYSATYLPEVASEQGWDHETTLAELLHKSGYRGKGTVEVFNQLKITRYQSSKTNMAWAEYTQTYYGK
jgi:hypothetical protein